MSNGGFIWMQIAKIFFFIDNALYGMISILYQLIYHIANVDLISNSTIQNLISRIYVFLGIFMLFKVSFSMIQYLVDPESFSDQSKGIGKLVTNVLISFVLVVSIPWIFSKAYKLQDLIISENVINRLILGERFVDNSAAQTGVSGSSDNINKTLEAIDEMGKDLSFSMFSGFFQLNTSSPDLNECASSDKYPNSPIIGSADMAAKDSCIDQFSKITKNEMTATNTALTDFFKYEDNDKVIDKRTFEKLGILINVKDSKGDSIIKYNIIISSIVGGYLLLLLVSFCIDIAARVFKLCFLQMIAPIAIISYIDPKESTSDGKLNRWAKETLSTYASLFIRLAVIFLVIKLGETLSNMIASGIKYQDGFESNDSINFLVFITLILGLFTFAKEVPKQLEKIFNLEGIGSLQLNPIKALNENMGLRMGIGGTLGTALSGKANYTAARASGKGRLGSFGSAVGGAVSGGVRGITKGVNANGMKDVANASLDIAGRTSARTALYTSQGVTPLSIPKKVGLAWERTADKHGILTKGDIWKNRLTGYQNVISTGETLKKDIEERAKKSQNKYMDGKTYKQYFDDLDLEQKIVEKGIKADMKEEEREDISKRLKVIQMKRKMAVSTYGTNSSRDENFDSVIHKEVRNYEEHATKVFGEEQTIDSHRDIKRIIDNSKGKINEIQSDSKKTEAIERSEAVSDSARQIAQGIYNSNSDRILRGPGGPGGHGGPPIGGDS